MHARRVPGNTCREVKLRLGVGVILAIAVAFVLVVGMRVGGLGVGGFAEQNYRGAAWDRASSDVAVWRQENAYLEQENWDRLSAPTDAEVLPARDIPELPGSIRVLVLGDSFVWGTGVLDPDMRWWVELQNELDARTSPGTFTVRAVGTPGASTMSQSAWLRSGVLNSVDPAVVVVPYVANDSVPHPADFEPGGLCHGVCPALLNHVPEFIDCFQRERSEAVCRDLLRESYPDAVVFSEVVDRPLDGPYSAAFGAAIRSIAEVTSGRVLLWMPTPVDPADWANAQLVESVFAQAGFTLVSPERTVGLLRPLPSGSEADPDRHLNPDDAHPGPVLTRAYATDMADAIMAAVPPEEVAAAEQAARTDPPQVTSLVSWVLPSSVQVTSTASSADVQLTAATGARAGDQQGSPCASLARPHARLSLSRLLTPGTRLALTMVDGPAAGLAVFAFGYDADGTTTMTEVGTVGVGESLEVRSGPLARGIVLADTAVSGCGGAPSLPNARVTVTVR